MVYKFTIFVISLLMINNLAFSRANRVSQLPNGNKFACLNCHTSPYGGGANTAFGTKIKTSYLSNGNVVWNASLAALDSDGDGVSNGQELGDPNGTWKIGDANPGDPNAVTNPGDSKSVTGIEELLLSKNFIQINSISPNPVSINSEISFSTKESANVDITLFDANGNFVMNIFNENLNQGDYSVKLFNNNEFKSLSSSLYFIKLKVGNYFLIEKLIINK